VKGALEPEWGDCRAQVEELPGLHDECCFGVDVLAAVDREEL